MVLQLRSTMAPQYPRITAHSLKQLARSPALEPISQRKTTRGRHRRTPQPSTQNPPDPDSPQTPVKNMIIEPPIHPPKPKQGPNGAYLRSIQSSFGSYSAQGSGSGSIGLHDEEQQHLTWKPGVGHRNSKMGSGSPKVMGDATVVTPTRQEGSGSYEPRSKLQPLLQSPVELQEDPL